MLSFCLLVTCMFLGILYFTLKRQDKLAFPGPKGLPLVGSFFAMRGKSMPDLLLGWSKQFGGVFTFSLLNKQYLVVSSPDALREALVTRGKEYAGRPNSYRMEIRSDGFQDIAQTSNLALHKTLRVTSQSVLNLYGRGRGRIEAILDATVDKLLENFQKRDGLPFDAQEDLYEVTTLTMIMLVR